VKSIVKSDLAATPQGFYSQAVLAEGVMYLSGQIGLRKNDPTLPEGLEQQIKQAMRNIADILFSRGLGFQHLVAMTCYLSEGQEWSTFDQIYGECLEGHELPARTTIFVKALPLGALVEITAIAQLP
jgi:2-iminobutanoate/2-iminopropanoate deaminase